jgi:hypothetical protein
LATQTDNLALKGPAPAQELSQAQETAQMVLCCECPWHQENPWTDYPEFPAWCAWYMDNLVTANPSCIEYRQGKIPKPDDTLLVHQVKLDIVNWSEVAIEEGKTCFDCYHFRQALSSPNPTQAWGSCRKKNRGRFGVAKICKTFKPKGEPAP